jgi:hypothetical protein
MVYEPFPVNAERARANRSQPMAVKHWSFAGLLLTYRCNARCESCYLCCGPRRDGEMTVADAIEAWDGLVRASPHGCRVHLSGGEPFLNWPLLIDVCRAAKREGLAPLEKVETNAFWADSEEIVRDRARQLDEAGMETLAISADPYHQQFVPIERARLAAAAAREVLGAGRVRVRWEDWLREGESTAGLDEPRRAELFLRYASGGRDRLTGRLAERLAPALPRRPAETWAASSCRESLLRSRHVHVGPEGLVMPGTCAGVVLGRLGPRTAADVWESLRVDHAQRPIVGRLAAGGPCALLAEAAEAGMPLREGYAGKCHLCWDLRRFLASRGLGGEELGPDWIYRNQA